MWKRLFTHEDAVFGHAHKLVGGLCLINFLFQFGRVFAYGEGYFPEVGWFTPFVIGLHGLLHLTSFQFKLSSRRNKTYNIIWPEMRWHAMIFAFRSLVTMGAMHFLPFWASYGLRGPIVMLTMVCADFVTWYYKTRGMVAEHDSTMRGNPYPAGTPEWVIRYLNLFYSASQVLGTMNVLTSTDISRVFWILFPIQTAPFGMTLVRKGILDQRGWHVFYTLALLMNYVYPTYASPMPRGLYWGLAMFFMLARFKFGANKYVLWGIVSGVQLLRNTTLFV